MLLVKQSIQFFLNFLKFFLRHEIFIFYVCFLTNQFLSRIMYFVLTIINNYVQNIVICSEELKYTYES